MRVLHNFLLVVGLRVYDVIIVIMAIILSPLLLTGLGGSKNLFRDCEKLIEELNGITNKRLAERCETIRRYWK